jgi:ferric hydroxamate transport system ATP-binding protein
MILADLAKPPAQTMETAGAGGAASQFELIGAAVVVGGRTLLRPLNLTLSAGQVTGLVGHNGSGKSTMLKLLARQVAPSVGLISLDGTPIHRWKHRAFARRVAYLPQQIPDAPDMLVHELVALGRYPWHGAFGRFGQLDRAKVAEAMALTDIEPLATGVVDMLSGGERQRVWLAMLVAQGSDWLVLDEPISALDIAHQVGMLELIRRLRQRGLGVVMAMHDINLAARYCDEIIALHSGRVIARGAAAAIMDQAQLKAIYGLSMDILHHPVDGTPICYVR